MKMSNNNSEKVLDFMLKLNYNTQAVKLIFIYTRRSRVVRPSAHDWKSCNTHKVFEGSNPSFSAKNKASTFCWSLVFLKFIKIVNIP